MSASLTPSHSPTPPVGSTLEELSARATPGPWTRIALGGGIEALRNGVRKWVAFAKHEDDEFIVRCVNDVRSGALVPRDAPVAAGRESAVDDWVQPNLLSAAQAVIAWADIVAANPDDFAHGGPAANLRGPAFDDLRLGHELIKE